MLSWVPASGSAPGWNPDIMRTPYSYRDDPAVPSFPDDRPLIVFDGACVLCSGFVRFVLRHDQAGRFRFLAAQSDLASAIYRHYGLPTDVWETNLLLAEGVLYTKSAAGIEITTRFGGIWSLMRLLRLLPRPLRDWIYDRIARNRYRWFGRQEFCGIADPAHEDRFLT
jgi:predicted DCC family thiol-disulfide oxidoreductase YuxK